MSYFFDAFSEYVLKERHTASDGQGGYFTEWQDGAVVQMSLDLGSSSEIRQAAAQDLKTVYTATFPIDTPVRYDDYLQSVEDGSVYRITSNPRDNKTPPTARHQLCFATAVRTELPK